MIISVFFFFSSRRRHTRSLCDWSSDVCSSDLVLPARPPQAGHQLPEQPEAEVGVVEATGLPEDDVVGAEPQVVEGAPRRALPPAAGTLRRRAGEVGEQLAHRAGAERG